jgi:PII-like signaling protein
VIDDWLKVTSYYGERMRVDGRLFSDVLLDTFEEYDVATSIVLRGAGGFGLRHHLRTDQTLTMSEDPSAMVVAGDTRPRVEELLPRLIGLQPRGMLTVERARVIRGDVTPGPMPEDLHEATKLTIYIGRHERVGTVPAYVAVCDLFHRRGVAGASVLLGVDGTSHAVRERARFWDRNLDVPAMVLAVGPGDRIEAVLPELETLLARPMVTVERVRVCKRDGELLARPPDLPATDDEGRGIWQKLMVYTSESRLHDGEPVHRAIVRRLRQTKARGATVLRGVWGYHGDHAPHGDRFWQLGRHAPMVTVVVDTPEGIASSFPVIDELTREHGLVTAEMVPALQYFDVGHPRPARLRLARHRWTG